MAPTQQPSPPKPKATPKAGGKAATAHAAEDSDDDDWSSSPVRVAPDMPAPLADASHVVSAPLLPGPYVPTLPNTTDTCDTQPAASPPAVDSPASTEEAADAACAADSEACSSPTASPIRQLRIPSPTPSPQPAQPALALETPAFEAREEGEKDSEASPATTVTIEGGDEAANDGAPAARAASAEPESLAEAVEASWLQRLSCTTDDLGFMAAFRCVVLAGFL